MGAEVSYENLRTPQTPNHFWQKIIAEKQLFQTKRSVPTKKSFQIVLTGRGRRVFSYRKSAPQPTRRFEPSPFPVVLSLEYPLSLSEHWLENEHSSTISYLLRRKLFPFSRPKKEGNIYQRRRNLNESGVVRRVRFQT